MALKLIENFRGNVYTVGGMATGLAVFHGGSVTAVYQCLLENQGASIETLSFMVRMSVKKVKKCIRTLYRLDFIYSDYEDWFCNNVVQDIYDYAESEYVFDSEPIKYDASSWSLFELYKRLPERDDNKEKIFKFLLKDDPDIVDRMEEDFPVHYTRKQIDKMKLGKSVKYFTKPMNSVGYPVRSWAVKEDFYWWLSRCSDRNSNNTTIERARIRRHKSRTVAPGHVGIESMSKQKVEKRLIAMGVENNLEEFTYWFTAFSSVLKQESDDRTFIENQYRNFGDFFDTSKKIRMIDVKLYHFFAEGFSKFDLFNNK